MSPADPPAMTSNRPYLIRAVHEWIGDNDMTPHLLVNAQVAGVRVPQAAIRDGKVVLNVSMQAVSQLRMGNEVIEFLARFSGVSQAVRIPVAAVEAIYAQETGQGMMLPEDDEGAPAAGLEGALPEDGPDEEPPPRRGGHLRVVK